MVASSAPARVSVSLATPNDAGAIAAFMRKLSAASRRRRFFCFMSDRAIEAEIAHELAPALAAISVIARELDSGTIVGHAVAFPCSDDDAEVALAVADAYQNHQIGTHLLEQLMREARQRGIPTLRADVLAENRRMIDIFVRAGYALAREPETGVIHATMALGEPKP